MTTNQISTDILLACEQGKLENIRENQKIPLQSILDHEGNNLLMIAASKGHEDIVKYFLEDANFGDSFVNGRNKLGDTALSKAVIGDYITIVEELLKHGAKVGVYNKKGQSPIKLSHSKGIAKLLLKNRAIINFPQSGSEGWTDLMWAASEGSPGLVEALLEQGRSITQSDRNGKTALTVAAEYGRLEILNMLFSHPSTIEVLDSKDKSGRTPLMWAVAKGHRQVAEMLVARGADVNAVDIKGTTALIFAASFNHVDLIALLAEHGASINHEDRDGLTALYKAATMGHTETVKWFLEHNAHLESSNPKAGSVIFSAVRSGKADIVNDVLNAFVNSGNNIEFTINQVNEAGDSALHVAAKLSGSSSGNAIIQALINSGADTSILNAEGKDYKTVMDAAVKSQTDKVNKRFEAKRNRATEQIRGTQKPLSDGNNTAVKGSDATTNKRFPPPKYLPQRNSNMDTVTAENQNPNKQDNTAKTANAVPTSIDKVMSSSRIDTVILPGTVQSNKKEEHVVALQPPPEEIGILSNDVPNEINSNLGDKGSSEKVVQGISTLSASPVHHMELTWWDHETNFSSIACANMENDIEITSLFHHSNDTICFLQSLSNCYEQQVGTLVHQIQFMQNKIHSGPTNGTVISTKLKEIESSLVLNRQKLDVALQVLTQNIAERDARNNGKITEPEAIGQPIISQERVGQFLFAFIFVFIFFKDLL